MTVSENNLAQKINIPRYSLGFACNLNEFFFRHLEYRKAIQYNNSVAIIQEKREYMSDYMQSEKKRDMLNSNTELNEKLL